jgi:hypothetical protein
MGWEIRHGKRVYIRKVREGSRVRSIYFGFGERAEAAAREDEERRVAVALARLGACSTPVAPLAASAETPTKAVEDDAADFDVERWRKYTMPRRELPRRYRTTG